MTCCFRRMTVAIISAACLSNAAFAVEVPDCKGKIQLTRVVQIKPGKIDLFKQSVADLQAWFKAHGKPDTFEIGRELMQPIGSDVMQFKDRTAIIVRSNVSFPLSPDKPAVDPAWVAFDKEFTEATAFPSFPVLTCIAPLEQ